MKMYNPFPVLTKGMLMDQLEKDRRWFVRQTFPRGREPRLRGAFLIRGYEAGERVLADDHRAALEKDPNAFLYDAMVPEHRNKLLIAATQPFGYKIYYAAKKGPDWKPPAAYVQRIRRYITSHHPNWRAGSEGGEIEVGIHEVFGELFIKFSHGREEDMVPFGVIEQISPG